MGNDREQAPALILDPFEAAEALLQQHSAPPPSGSARVVFVGELDPGCERGLGMSLRTAAVNGVLAHSVLLALRVGAQAPVFVSEADFALQLALTLAEPTGVVAASLLGPAPVPRLLAEKLQSVASPLLLDVNLLRRDGRPNCSDEAIALMRRKLFERASLVVANTQEAELLTGRRVLGEDGQRQAVQRLADLGAGRVLLTGGRMQGHALDLFFDGHDVFEFGVDRIPQTELRGAGEVLCASIAARLALGEALLVAVEHAKAAVTRAIRGARKLVDYEVCEPLR